MKNSNKGFAPIVILLIIAGVLVLAGGGYFAYQKFMPQPKIIGGDKDAGGCLIGAGYSWCEVRQKCLRVWEEKCEIPVSAVEYSCKDGKIIQAEFYKGESVAVKPDEMPQPSGSVSLKLSDGRNMLVPQTISASGIRYANPDDSFIFWSKGDTAFVEEKNEQTYSDCVVKN